MHLHISVGACIFVCAHTQTHCAATTHGAQVTDEHIAAGSPVGRGQLFTPTLSQKALYPLLLSGCGVKKRPCCLRRLEIISLMRRTRRWEPSGVLTSDL